MRIAIIGAGSMGQALARHLARLGHEVALSNSRGPESLGSLVDDLGPGVSAAEAKAAVAPAEVVFVAIPYKAVEETLPAAGPYDGKVVVDLTNYFPPRDGVQLDPKAEASTAVVARHLAGARVVKAFNTIWSKRLEDDARPAGPDQLAIPVAGDDPEAVALVAGLVRDMGFAPVQSGPLRDSKRQEPGSPVYNEPITAEEARERLGSAA